MDLRVVVLLTFLGNITVRQSSVNSAKILNGSVRTSVRPNFLAGRKFDRYREKVASINFVTGK